MMKCSRVFQIHQFHILYEVIYSIKLVNMSNKDFFKSNFFECPKSKHGKGLLI